MIVEQFPELASLSAEQKLTLADELTYLAIAQQDDHLRTIVRERISEYPTSPEDVKPWAQVMAEVLASKSNG